MDATEKVVGQLDTAAAAAADSPNMPLRQRNTPMCRRTALSLPFLLPSLALLLLLLLTVCPLPLHGSGIFVGRGGVRLDRPLKVQQMDVTATINMLLDKAQLLTDTVQRQSVEIDRLLNTVAAQQQTIDALSFNLTSTTIRLGDATTTIQAMARDVSKVNATLLSFRESTLLQVNSLEQKTNTLTNNVNSVNSTLHVYQGATNQLLTTVQSQQTLMNNRITSMDSTLTGYSEVWNNQLTTLQQQSNTFQQAIQAVNSTFNTINNQISNVQQAQTSINNQIATVNNTFNTFSAQTTNHLTNIDQQQSVMNNHIQSVNNTFNSYSSSVTNSLTNIQQQQTTLINTIQTVNGTLDFSSLINQLTTLEQQQTLLANSIHSVNNTLNSYSSSVNQQLTSIEQQTNVLSSSIHTVNNTLVSYSSSTTNQLNTLQQQTNNINNNLNAVNNTFHSYTAVTNTQLNTISQQQTLISNTVNQVNQTLLSSLTTVNNHISQVDQSLTNNMVTISNTINSVNQTLSQSVTTLTTVITGGDGGVSSAFTTLLQQLNSTLISDLKLFNSTLNREMTTIHELLGSVNTPGSVIYQLGQVTTNITNLQSLIGSAAIGGSLTDVLAQVKALLGSTAITGSITTNINDMQTLLGTTVISGSVTSNLASLLSRVDNIETISGSSPLVTAIGPAATVGTILYRLQAIETLSGSNAIVTMIDNINTQLMEIQSGTGSGGLVTTMNDLTTRLTDVENIAGSSVLSSIIGPMGTTGTILYRLNAMETLTGTNNLISTIGDLLTRLTEAESLTGLSTLVTTLNGMNGLLTDISILNGTSNVVTAVNSLITRLGDLESLGGASQLVNSLNNALALTGLSPLVARINDVYQRLGDVEQLGGNSLLVNTLSPINQTGTVLNRLQSIETVTIPDTLSALYTAINNITMMSTSLTSLTTAVSSMSGTWQVLAERTSQPYAVGSNGMSLVEDRTTIAPILTSALGYQYLFDLDPNAIVPIVNSTNGAIKVRLRALVVPSGATAVGASCTIRLAAVGSFSSGALATFDRVVASVTVPNAAGNQVATATGSEDYLYPGNYVVIVQWASATAAVAVVRVWVETMLCGSCQPTPILPTITPALTSGLMTGEILTADPGSFTGGTYQWRRCDSTGLTCSDIAGATNRNYTLLNGDVTYRVTVAVSHPDVGSGPGVATPTIVVTPRPPPTISAPFNPPIEDDVLTAVPGAWAGGTFQWQRCNGAGVACTNIVGATAATYTVVLADVGYRLTVLMTMPNTLQGTATPLLTTLARVPPSVWITSKGGSGGYIYWSTSGTVRSTQCSYWGGAWSPCSSPYYWPGGDGATFAVLVSNGVQSSQANAGPFQPAYVLSCYFWSAEEGCRPGPLSDTWLG